MVGDAMRLATELAQNLVNGGKKPLIYVGGSSYVVAQALKLRQPTPTNE